VLARSGRLFDVAELTRLVDTPDDWHRLGAALAAAQRSGLIVAVGARIAADGRLARLWTGYRERWDR
jgi:hypothetical protein